MAGAKGELQRAGKEKKREKDGEDDSFPSMGVPNEASPGTLLVLFLLICSTALISPTVPHPELSHIHLPHVNMPHVDLPHFGGEELWIPTEMIVTFCSLVVVAFLSFLLPPIISSVAWIVVPLLLTPGWVQLSRDASLDWSWFIWVKTWSAVLICAWAGLCRARPQTFSPRVAGQGLWSLLVVNILEAVVWDVRRGHPMNAAAGLLLCITLLPMCNNDVELVKRIGCSFINVDLQGSWIVAYTLWNACFTYINWHARVFGEHVAVLSAAAVIPLLLGRKAWLHGRVVTLGLILVT